MSLGEQLWGYGGGDPYEDNGNFPGLQFNPAPGVPQAVGDLVEDLNRAHGNITSASEALRNVSDGGWTGASADAFRAKTAALPKLLHDAGESFKLAHGVLQMWEKQLGSMQPKAHSYETEAQASRKRAEQAEKSEDLQLFRYGGIGMTDAEAEEAKQRYTAALNELGAAREELAGIIASAKNIRSQHEELAGTVAAVLKAASEQAPKGPGFFDDLKHGLSQLVKAQEIVARQICQWVKDHANAISAVGDVLSTVSAVVGAVGIGIGMTGNAPLAGQIGVASSVFAAGALALHGVARAAGGEDVVSNRTLAQDSLGLVPLAAGARVGGKLGTAILSSRAADGASNFGLVDSVASLFGDPSVFDNFVPKNPRQAIELGVGPLLPALENAWNKGSEKDGAGGDR
ncbi:putative T7SS-secreted protein [Streptomyces noursei]|uniref:putative T7SS-secreted protein n=1 Tax=Streptomyces noursei TaxID=1971 RepID=UPI0033F2E1A4